MRESIHGFERIPLITSFASVIEAWQCLAILFGSLRLCSKLGASEVQRKGT